MIKRAYQDGALAALKQFNVREAVSWMDMLLGIGTPMAAKAGLNVLAPKLMPKIEKGLEVPFKAVKDMGGGIARAVRGPSTPAEAFAHQLTHSGIPGAAEHAQAVQSAPMPHIEHMPPPRGPK